MPAGAVPAGKGEGVASEELAARDPEQSKWRRAREPVRIEAALSSGKTSHRANVLMRQCKTKDTKQKTIKHIGKRAIKEI